MLNIEKKINRHLLTWYNKNKRDLPWRKLYTKNKLPNPYFILVSEFMLQQTTVNAVKYRFIDFIRKWPTLKKLCNADETQILNFWSGLGYYSRAKNLLKSAKLIQKNFNSKIPNNYDDLISLPGIGDYTAKAILGIAYNQAVFPTDANIERIIVRIYSIEEPIIKIKKKIKLLAKNFISEKYSSNLIQSFMDYGSSICLPRNPKCDSCNIIRFCQSYKKNLHLQIPTKLKKIYKKPVKYTRAYVIVNENKEILVRTRPDKGMLASMLEVPNDIWVKNKKALITDQTVKSLKTKLRSRGLFEYSFSHFDLETEIFYCNVRKSQILNASWIKKSNYSKSGLPTIMKKIVKIAI